MKLLAVIQLTFRESLAKKVFLAFLGISTFICLLFIFALNLDVVNGVKSGLTFFGKRAPRSLDLQAILWRIESGVAVLLFTGGLFMSLFATSNLIPALLQPGTIDLYISKPLSRYQILLGRYLGAVGIVAFNVFYLVIFSWLVLSLKTGLWNWGYLLSGLMIVLTFAILYALMTFLGVVTHSSAISLMLTYLVLFFSPLLLQRDTIYALLSSKIYGYLLDGLYYFLPKTAELGALTQQVVQGGSVSSWMPLWSGILFAIFMLFVSGSIFSRKNF